MSAAGYQNWRERNAINTLATLGGMDQARAGREVKLGDHKHGLEFFDHDQGRMLAEFTFVEGRVDLMYVHAYSRGDIAGIYNIMDARNFYRALVRAGYTPVVDNGETAEEDDDDEERRCAGSA